MLYTVSLDKDDFILSVAHTKNDSVSLNLEDMELEYLSAYQLINNEAVLNEERKAELIAEKENQEKEEQITELVMQLESSTDDLLEFIEDLFTLKNPLTFAADLFELRKNYKALVENRKSIREKIKKLKGE